MDFGKCVKAAKLPTMIIAILVVLYAVFAHFVPTALCYNPNLPLPLIVLWVVLLGWAGFKAVKEEKLDWAGGCLTILIAGIASIIMVILIGMVLSLAGFTVCMRPG
jgi:ammonia channel protein AmtB